MGKQRSPRHVVSLPHAAAAALLLTGRHMGSASLRGLPLEASMRWTDQTTKTEEARWIFNRKTGPTVLTPCPFLFPKETHVFSCMLSEHGNCKKREKNVRRSPLSR